MRPKDPNYEESVRQLEREAVGFHILALVIRFTTAVNTEQRLFARHCELILAGQAYPNLTSAGRQERLNEMVDRGGQPIGFVGMQIRKGLGGLCDADFVHKPLPNYVDDPEVDKLLKTVADKVCNAATTADWHIGVD